MFSLKQFRLNKVTQIYSLQDFSDLLIFNRPTCSSPIGRYCRQNFPYKFDHKSFFFSLKNRSRKQALEHPAAGYNLNFKLSWITFLRFPILMLSCIYFTQPTSVLWVTTLYCVLYHVGSRNLVSDNQTIVVLNGVALLKQHLILS